MDILTDPKVLALPKLYSQEHVDDPIVTCRFWHVCSDWYWYPTEYSPEDGLFFGYVRGFEGELGYFSVAEFKEVEDHTGLPYMVDDEFKPTPLSEVKKLPNRQMPDQGVMVIYIV